MSSPHDSHRLGSGVFSPYDYSARRRSSSPRRYAYDSYVPSGSALCRDDHPNSYRPGMWRPERHLSRSPSPGRHHRTRVVDGRHWDPASRRQSSYYPDRHSPPGSPRDKPRRDTMAERMFEPSDTWRYTPVDRSARYEASGSTSVRYVGHRTYFGRDGPHRLPPRTDFVQPLTGDCYRPHASSYSSRDMYSFPRIADSYRPQYDDELRRPSYSTDSLGSTTYRGRRDYDDDCHSSSVSSTPPRLYTRSLSPPPRTSVDTNNKSSPRKPSIPCESPIYSPRPSTPPKPCSSPSSDPYPRLTPDSLVRHPSPSSYTCHQPPSNPLGEHSQRNVPSLPPRSPTVGEPPRKKFKSRSSSPSSTASGRVQSAISEAKNKPFVDHLPAQFDGAATQLATPRSTSQDQDIPQEDSAASAQGMYIGSSTCQLTSHETTHVTNELSDRNINLDLHLPSPVTTVPASDDYTVPTQASPERVDGSPMGSELPKEIPREPLSSSNAAGATSLATPERTSEPPLPSHNTAEEGELLSSAAHPSPVCQLPNANAHSTTAISGLKVGVGITSSAQRAISSPQIVVSDHSAVSVHLHPKPRSQCQPSEEPMSMRDGLRLVVLSRLRRDRQTRDERVFPLLRANQVVSDLQCVPGSSDSQSRLFKDTMGDGRVNERTAEHDQIRSAFVDHFFKRQSKIAAKAERLKEEYLALHERWLEHCARLDEEQKSGITEEVAVPSGRATRRSTAILGDAVRSDLEMEQIIASLGVEELTDPNYLAIKNVAKIPDMISVTHGCVSYVFDDTNNVIDNPAEFYGACSGSDYWTEEERDIFLREFAAHPKQFGVIAEQLPNKTAAQCVTYYYLQKKQGVDFRKAVAQYGVGRRRRNGRSAKQRGNALLTDIRRHDDEVSRVSSAAALNGPTSGKRRRAANVQNGEQRRTNPLRRVAAQPEVSASSATTPDPEVEPPRRRRRPAASRLLISSVADSVENDTVGKEVEGRTSKRGRKSRTATSETLMTPSEEAITPVVDPSPSEDPEDAAVQRTPLAPNTWSEDDKSADPPLSAC